MRSTLVNSSSQTAGTQARSVASRRSITAVYGVAWFSMNQPATTELSRTKGTGQSRPCSMASRNATSSVTPRLNAASARNAAVT